MKASKKKCLYLVLSPYKGYDDFYIPLSEKEKTWAEVLSNIEYALDDAYLEHDTIEGISLSIKIVKDIPEDVELQ